MSVTDIKTVSIKDRIVHQKTCFWSILYEKVSIFVSNLYLSPLSNTKMTSYRAELAYNLHNLIKKTSGYEKRSDNGARNKLNKKGEKGKGEGGGRGGGGRGEGGGREAPSAL